MKYLRILLALFILASAGPSSALLIRGGFILASNTSFDKSLINLGAAGDPFINKFHYCGVFANNFADVQVDANGYPLNGNEFLTCNTAPIVSGEQYTFIFPATRGGGGGTGTAGGFNSDAAWTGCTALTNASVSSGCTGGSVTLAQTTPGQPMRATLTAASNSLGDIHFGALGDGTSGTGEIAIIRTSDCLRFTGTSDCSGTSILEYLTPEVVSLYAGMHPRAVRGMDWSQINFGNDSLWTNRATPNAMNWNYGGGAQFLAGTISAAAVSGTDTFVAEGGPNTPSSWTDGEQIIAGFTNGNTNTTYSAEVSNSGNISLVVASSTGFAANQTVAVATFSSNDPAQYGGPTWTVLSVPDSTHVVLKNSIYQSSAASDSGFLNIVPTVDIQYCNPTCVSRGAKQLVTSNGNGYLAGTQLSASGNSNSMYTLTYNAALDKVLLQSGGITGMVPLEVQVHLANLVGTGYWANVPAMYTDASVTQYTSTVCTNLTSSQGAFFEYANEVWNFQFNSFGFAIAQGANLGFPIGNNEQYLGYYGLHIADIMGSVIPTAWSGAGCSSSNMHREFAWQSGGDSNIVPFGFKGADLVSNKAYAIAGTTLTCGTATLVTTPGGSPSGFENTWPVTFTGSLCTGMSSATTYYVSNVQDKSSVAFYISATPGGAPLSTTGTASGVTVTYTNPYYAAMIGTAHNALPNRPIDQVERSAFAPYTGATAFFYGADTGAGDLNPSSLNAALYQNVINDWEGGNTTGAIALINADIQTGISYTATMASFSGTTITTTTNHQFVSHASGGGLGSYVVFNVTGGTCPSGLQCNNEQMYQVTSVPASNEITVQIFSGGFPSGADINLGTPGTGTVTISWVGGQCVVSCSSWPYPANWNGSAMPNSLNGFMAFAEANAAAMDGDRPSGMAPLITDQYEATLELFAPPQSVVTTMGLTGTTPEASLQNAVFGWLNSASAAALINQFYNQFIGKDPTVWTYNNPSYTHAANGMPAQYGVFGPRSLSQSWAILSGGSDTSTPYQLYNGITTFNTNWLLKRDLDPASNDNDPMWLAKAA